MTVTYKKLWHILIDRNMKKKDLQEQAGITKYALNKLSRNEDVTTETLGRICAALNCTTDDIIEFLPDKEKEQYLQFQSINEVDRKDNMS